LLTAELHKRLGQVDLSLTLEAAPGSTLVLVGESGSGKTSALRLMAGLSAPDRGHLSVNGTTWFSSADQLSVPPWRRAVGYVPQDSTLFPHLSVMENVAFGLQAQGLRRATVASRAGSALERFGIAPLRNHRPAQLSGGQQQRVALARALVLEPELLLLDEPLSALDQLARREIRQELRQLLGELTCVSILVTHNPVEALVFGDMVAVLENGKAEQVGSREDLLRRPRSAFIAEFMGVNLFQGSVAGRKDGVARLQTADGELAVMEPDTADSEVFASVSPREITLHLEAPTGSAQNVFFGPIREIIPEPPHGERLRIALATHPPLVAEVTSSAARGLGLAEGMVVYAAFKATGVLPYK
jgi:molybdate transport system ATP-binding protein